MSDEKIKESVESIRKKYKSELEDPEDTKASFQDEVNALVQTILDDDATDVYTALKPEELERWKKRKLRRWVARKIKNLPRIREFCYFVLLAVITGFLVSEALDFYTVDGVTDTKTYVKAILTEVCFIFLSGYRSNGKLQAIGAGALRVSLFTLMMFVITSQTFTVGTKNISEVQQIQQQIEILNTQIKEKDKQIEYYRSIGWPRNATMRVQEREKLLNKLLELKQQQAAGKSEAVSRVEEVKMYGKAAFRVILLFISVLITRRLFSF